MDNAEYHAMFDRVSTTQLKQFDACPVSYRAMYVDKTRNPPDLSSKRVVKIGDLVHQVLLERKDPDEIATLYPADCFKSNGAINPKPAREFESLMAEEGKVVLKDGDLSRVTNVCNSVRKHPLGLLLTNTDLTFEQPIFWTDLGTGIDCKARPDFMYEDEEMVLCYDLKVTEAVHPKKWSRVARNLRYWVQAAHYSSGLAHITNKPVRFVFWAVESVWPYRVGQFEFDTISMERANEGYVRILERLKNCMESGIWTEQWERESNYLTVEPWDLDTEDEDELEGFEDE